MSLTRTTRLLALIAVTAFLSLSTTSSRAATWTVEKDGSGDFAIIQDAIDAASPGDTILIGPGRYDSMQARDLLLSGVRVSSIIWVQTPNLTITGAGQESTIVGPASYIGEFDTEHTSSLIVDADSDCTVSGMGFENTRFEVYLAAPTTMEDCEIARGAFRADHSLFVTSCAGVEIRGVAFIDSGGVVTHPGASDLLIEDCTFVDASDWTYAIQISNGTPNVTVRNCTITGGSSGIQYSGTGIVEDCTMTGQKSTGLQAVGGGHMIARRCHVGVTRSPLWVSIGRLELYDSVLEGGTRETIYSTAEVYVRNSHILNAGGWSVVGRTSVPGEFIDLRNNWWGTSDAAQVEAWINDNYGTVLWDPINDMAIPAEKESVGGLKGKFGRNGQ